MTEDQSEDLIEENGRTNIPIPDPVAIRCAFVRAREEGTGDVHRLDVRTFERRLNLLLDELCRIARQERP